MLSLSGLKCDVVFGPDLVLQPQPQVGIVRSAIDHDVVLGKFNVLKSVGFSESLCSVRQATLVKPSASSEVPKGMPIFAISGVEKRGRFVELKTNWNAAYG